METRINYFSRLSLLVSVIFFLNLQSFSQGTDSRRITSANKNNMYIGLSIDPISSKISNEGFSDVLSIKGGNSLNFSIDAGYFFSDLIGISIGAGYSSYSTKLSLDSSSYKFMTTDDEDEQFEMRIKGRSIEEDQNISLLSIPVSLIFRFAASEKIGLYLKPGISFDIPLLKKYDGNGIFTYDAYYAEYPVLLQDLPELGFPSNYATNVSEELEIKSINMALTVSGGMSYSVSEKMVLLLGATLNRSVGNVSAYEEDSGFRLTTEQNELRSMMAGSKNSGLQAFGFSIGIRYFLK
jgi:hypothetical protein